MTSITKSHVAVAVLALVALAFVAALLKANSEYDERYARPTSSLFTNDCLGTDDQLQIVAKIANETGRLPGDPTSYTDPHFYLKSSACEPQQPTN